MTAALAATMLQEVLGPDIVDHITPEASLVGDLGADSLDLVELQMVLEDSGIVAPASAFPLSMTVRDLQVLTGECPPSPELARAI